MRLSTRWAAVAAVSLIAAGCGGAGASTAPTQAAATTPATTGAATAAPATQATIAAPTSLITAGTIVDCVDIEYPPMEMFPSSDVTDPNLAIGFDVDSAKAVAAKLGLQITIRNTGFDALIPDLTNGRCDIVWTALYINPTRLEVADAVPYLATHQQIMVPTGNPKAIKSLDDLCGKTISIQSGGLVEKRANDQSAKCVAAGKPAITIQGYPKVADELLQIVNGKVDAVWETDSAVKDFMTKNPGQYEVAYTLEPDNYGVYYGKGKADIGTAFTAALSALKADGTLAALCTKYQIDPAKLEAIK